MYINERIIEQNVEEDENENLNILYSPAKGGFGGSSGYFVSHG
jgi:hypothetical protein